MKQHIVETLQKYIDSQTKKVKGISVIVTTKDKTIFEYASGIVDGEKTPNDVSRMFSIGSNTKLLTAIAIFQLVDKKLLDIDEDIKTYIPEFEVQSLEEYDKITVRQILMHRSGIQGDDYRLFFDETKTQEVDILPILKETYLCTKPGTMYAYSNLAYSVLGILIERLSLMPYVDYIQTHVFEPLALHMMFLPTLQDKEREHHQISRGFTKKGQVVNEDLTTLIAVGCCTYATPDDMATFLRFFLNHETQTLLSQESMTQLFSPPPSDMYEEDESGHGLGVAHNLNKYLQQEVGPVIGHGGATMYHMSEFQLFPTLGIGVSVMCNTEGGVVPNRRIVERIVKGYLDDKGITMKPLVVTPPSTVTKFQKQYVDSIVSFAGKFSIAMTKKGKLLLRMSILRAQVIVDEDGIYHLKPVGLSRIPVLSKSLKRMQVFRKEVDDAFVYYLKQYGLYSYRISAFGTSLRAVEDVIQYSYLEGTYERINDIGWKEDFGKKATIRIKDKMIQVKIKIEGSTQTMFFYPIAHNVFLVQGYGRYALTKATIERDGKAVRILLFGLTLQKKLSKKDL